MRDAIVGDVAGWEAIVRNKAFVKRFGGLTEDDPGVLLKRLPRGYAAGHPAERWLRFKSFTVSRALSDAEATGAKVADLAMKDYAVMLPLTRWLNRAMGFLPKDRR